MKITLFSCSKNPKSKSRILAKAILDQLGPSATLVDLADYDLPLCDGGASYGHPSVVKLNAISENSDAIILLTPIYNYTINSTAKSLIEHVGRKWTNKPLAFGCSAGGQGSFMALTEVINSVMLDFRCFVLPRYLYTTESHYENNQLTHPSIEKRLHQFCQDFTLFAQAIHQLTPNLTPE